MKSFFKIFIILFSFAHASYADMSSGLESGRYQSSAQPRKPANAETRVEKEEFKIKYKKKTAKNKKSEKEKQVIVDVSSQIGEKSQEKVIVPDSQAVTQVSPHVKIETLESAPTPIITKKVPVAVATASPTPSTMPTQALVQQTVPSPTPAPEAAVTQENTETPSRLESVRTYVWGDQEMTIQAYQEQVHPDDPRLNHLEFDLLPSVWSVQSQSNHSVRDYNAFSNAIAFSPRFALTPHLVLHLKYVGSFGASISANSGGSDSSKVKFENIDLGFRFKKYYGLSRKAMSFSYGIDFSENKTTPPSGDDHRWKLKTSGFQFVGEVRMPSTPQFSWVVGGSFAPRLNHSEQSTGIDSGSGDNPESNRIGFKIGGEYKMNRQDQIIWNLEHQVETNLFSGEAEATDPKSGLKPENVSVNHSQTIFSFGYRWGQ